MPWSPGWILEQQDTSTQIDTMDDRLSKHCSPFFLEQNDLTKLCHLQTKMVAVSKAQACGRQIVSTKVSPSHIAENFTALDYLEYIFYYFFLNKV